VSDLTRALRKAEDAVFYALLESESRVSQDCLSASSNGKTPALAGLHRKMFDLLVDLRAIANHVELYENGEAIGANIGAYDDQPWFD
jgi:hypothetical protein